MTPVGHSLVGASIGAACMPPLKSLRARVAFLLSFALLGNIPDVAVPGWGHDRYRVSHSLWVNLALIVVVATMLRLGSLGSRRAGCAGLGSIGSPVVILGGAMAWLSHLLLDSFYNHGKGIAMFWPFSDARLALPIPWLGMLHGSPPPLELHTLKVCSIELLFFGSILLAAVVCRRLLRSRSRGPGSA